MGPTHLLNPLHPAVRARLRGYVRALLEKIGDLTDALVMDEAYFVGYGMMGPPACPGYADRAQLTLIGELTAICHDYWPDMAFLTADMLGRPDVVERAFPYSLYADGIYHDACYWPESWDCVRFPAWRNVAWSCNWAPVTNLAWTRWGVLAHNAPVAISNGCWGDDTGLSTMEPGVARQIAGLWRVRAGRVWDNAARVIDAAQ